MPIVFVKVLEIAAQLNHPNAIAAFAAVLESAVIYMLLNRKAKGRGVSIPLVVAAVGIVILGGMPLFAGIYFATHGLYEVRVVALGEGGVPVSDVTVVCVPGGEKKSIAEGVECDIPLKNVPVDRKFTAYVSIPSVFMSGKGELYLGDDYSPVLTVQLKPMPSGRVKGTVVGKNQQPVSGAHVWVMGYGNEQVSTTVDGTFDLSAHAAKGQMLQLHARAPTYQDYEGLAQAGDSYIRIPLK